MEQILNDLVKSWWNNPLPAIKERDANLMSYFDPNVRKIISVIGFRRVGKTFTLLDFAQKYGKDKCVYINFEDERIPKKTEVLSKLIDLLTELKGNEPFVLLMDEIQEIPEWSMWARRMNETTQHRLILSGSSSKLSSREIPTELRGQTITIPMFPLNWNEFLRFRGADIQTVSNAHILNLLREYLQFGGMPEIVLAEEGLRPLIVSDYLSSFVNRDIVERYGLRNTEAFTDLLRLLPNTRSYTYSKLTNSLKSLGHAISKATVIRYMRWLEWSFFASRLEVFSSNVKNRIQTMKKLYLVDNYFSSQFSSNFSANIGHLMEQAVFHMLQTNAVWDPRNELFYWKDYSDNEVDFVVLQNSVITELIQVTFASNIVEVPERETKALIKAAKSMHQSSGTVVTWNLESRVTMNGIQIDYIPLWKWLGKSNSQTEILKD
jgi:predicted AAA+ superfamily ATPase